ncbi:MAG: hypothetical protein ACK4WJ_03410 [Endomicrobiia bacterium]
MKQILKLFVFQLIFLSQTIFSQEINVYDNTIYKYEKFLKEYKFKIYSSKKEVGYINIKISSIPVVENSQELFRSEIESFADIPILFFIGNTENYEIEFYDKNFTPIRSSFISIENKKEYVTSTYINKKDENLFECYITKKGKTLKEKKFDFSPPILTPGNIIPLVTTLWDFKNQRSINFKFIDKDILKLGDLRLEYLGDTENGFYKIKAVLPYFKLKFIIYLDKDKNIQYATGLGLKIYAEDYKNKFLDEKETIKDDKQE